MAEQIDRDEWLAELERVYPRGDNDSAMTAFEIECALGCCRQTARKKIRALINLGLAEVVKRSVTCMDGTVRPYAAYRLVKQQQPKRKKQ